MTLFHFSGAETRRRTRGGVTLGHKTPGGGNMTPGLIIGTGKRKTFLDKTTTLNVATPSVQTSSMGGTSGASK